MISKLLFGILFLFGLQLNCVLSSSLVSKRETRLGLSTEMLCNDETRYSDDAERDVTLLED